MLLDGVGRILMPGLILPSYIILTWPSCPRIVVLQPIPRSIFGELILSEYACWTILNDHAQYDYTLPFMFCSMICAKGNQGTDTCKGDSGSALVCGGRLTGISSFTSSMCKTDLPAGLAKLTDPSIRSFICKETGVFMFRYV